VPTHRDQRIGLNCSVKHGIVAVFMHIVYINETLELEGRPYVRVPRLYLANSCFLLFSS